MATDIHGEVKITKLDNAFVLQMQSTTNGNKHIIDMCVCVGTYV